MAGLDALHVSHRSALVRKDPERYRQPFAEEPDDLPYLWPPPVFPRWPLPWSESGLDVAHVQEELGVEVLEPEEVAAVADLRAGQDHDLDVLSTTTALLAGLCTAGRRSVGHRRSVPGSHDGGT